MIGATIRKFATIPMNTLDATRMPIRPPAPTIERSKVAVTPNCSKLVPRMFGIQVPGLFAAKW